MFRDGKLVSVIDWELSYLGHTETDLAFLCMQTETLQAMDKRVDGTPSDQEYLTRYEAASGKLVQHWEYFQMLIVTKVMCVYVCFGDVVPSAEMIWEYHRGLLEDAWTKARAAIAR
jgi:aminoglycoside phosphotransferase (APT) family kinase protein